MARSRFRWSEEDRAEIRKRVRMGFSHAEIAQFFGVTPAAISNVIKRHKLVTAAESHALKSERYKGRPLPKKVVKKLAKLTSERWRDPDYRARLTKMQRDFRADERGKQATMRAVRAAVRHRRGFDVPAHLEGEYRFLTKTKRLTAREAGEVLGLIGKEAA